MNLNHVEGTCFYFGWLKTCLLVCERPNPSLSLSTWDRSSFDPSILSWPPHKEHWIFPNIINFFPRFSKLIIIKWWCLKIKKMNHCRKHNRSIGCQPSYVIIPIPVKTWKETTDDFFFKEKLKKESVTRKCENKIERLNVNFFIFNTVRMISCDATLPFIWNKLNYMFEYNYWYWT